jgi:hypothetical protein
MRGCVTSGEQWVFFIYEKQDDDKGHVASSNELHIGPKFEGLALILGLLYDWVRHTHQHVRCFILTVTSGKQHDHF